MPVDAAYTAHFNPGFTLGVTEPHAGNTGYGQLGYTPGSLTDDTSPVTPKYIYLISADNTVVEGKRIHGKVQITGNNCTLRGCEIVSHPGIAYDTTANYALVSSSGTGNLIEYNHLTQYDPSASSDNSCWWMCGVLLTGGRCTVSRNDIHDINDAVYLNGGTHQVQGNYLHDFGLRTDDTDQSGSTPAFWSHNDGTQIMGGTNHVIDGNSYVLRWSRLTGMNNTAGNPDPYAEQVWPNHHGVFLQTYNTAVSGVQVTRNWFKYGSICVRWAPGNFDPGGATSPTGNRFTPDQGLEFSRYAQVSVDPLTSWGTITVDSSNVYSHDPDTPAAIQGLPLNGNWIDIRSGNPSTTAGVEIWCYNRDAHTP